MSFQQAIPGSIQIVTTPPCLAFVQVIKVVSLQHHREVHESPSTDFLNLAVLSYGKSR
jgi:hypothetical protein